MNVALSASQREFLLLTTKVIQERARRARMNLFSKLFPDEDIPEGMPDGSTIYARRRYPKHLEFFAAGATYRERCAMAANRIGKALRNSTPVATPAGWVPIGDLKVGDKVIAGDGSITTVREVYPQGEVQLYRLTFDRGEKIDCCGEHSWLVTPPAWRYPTRHSHGKRQSNPRYGQQKVMTTLQMLDQVGSEPGPRQRFVMPTSGTWDLPRKALQLDPYVMGALLGDGGMTSDTVSFTTADAEMVDLLSERLPSGTMIARLHSAKYGYGVVREKGSGKTNQVITALKAFGLMGERSENKHVPLDYLYADSDARLDLLRGLMDTDGTITKNGTPQFDNTSLALADAVRHLVISLGGTARMKQRQTHFGGKAGLPSWQVTMRIPVCPFLLKRKAKFWKPLHNTMDRVLRSIEKIDTDHATCIEVDHPSHTFVTDHGIVTHNSFGMGGYEMTCHLTGRYPDWWEGRQFTRPIKAWAAGKTNETTRDTVQEILMGESVKLPDGRRTFDGTGLIPGDLIGGLTFKKGGSDLIDIAKVRHVSGGWSRLGIKSYEQGRGAFEGTAQHVIWLDEEPPLDVYSECLIRTATTGGITMLTFTPLEGINETVQQFMETGEEED